MDRKYIAFISYRNVPLDAAVAKMLHRRIEQYIIPRKLRKKGKRFGSVFRDKEVLSVSGDLRQDLKDALDQSEYLIVVCSPDTANSKWVPIEIEHFLRHHEHNKVFVVLAKGDAETVIPEILRSRVDPESGKTIKVTPLAVDARGKTIAASRRKLRREITKLYAGMLGCPYDALMLRNERRFRRRIIGASLTVFLIALSFIVMLGVKNGQIERKNQEIEQQNQAIAMQNEELEQINQDLERQKREIQIRESELLTQNAWQALAGGDRYSAINSAVSALPSESDDRPYHAPAEQALIAAMGYLDEQQISFVSMHKTLASEAKVSDYCIAADGARIVSADIFGRVSCFDTATGDILWQKDTAFDSPWILSCEPHGSVIVSNLGGIESLSLDTGESLWSTEPGHSCYIARPLLSRDNQMLVCLDDSDAVISISAETGERLGYVGLFNIVDPYDLHHTFYVGNDIAQALSEDGNIYVGSFETDDRDQPHILRYYRVDLSTGTSSVIASSQQIESSLIPAYVSAVDNGQKMLAIRAWNEAAAVDTVEMYDLTADTLLWRTEIPQKTVTNPSAADKIYHQIQGDSLLIGHKNLLYLLDLHTGALRSRLELEQEIAAMVFSDESSYQLLAENGDYLTGKVEDGTLQTPTVMYATGVKTENLIQDFFIILRQSSFGTLPLFVIAGIHT